MNSFYNRFKEDRQKLKEENKEKFSERTLKYFEILSEAVTKEEYESNWNYLNSVLSYIEKEEFVSDKQVEICDVILDHPDAIIPEGQPF